MVYVEEVSSMSTSGFDVDSEASCDFIPGYGGKSGVHERPFNKYDIYR